MVVTDTRGQIVRWNRSAEELYGWEADEILGRSVLEVLQPRPISDEHGEGEVGIDLTDGEWSGDLITSTKSGERRRTFVTIAPIRDPSGEVVALGRRGRGPLGSAATGTSG